MRRTVLLAALLAAVACTEKDPIQIGTQAEGESCKQIADCMAGLTCEEAVCVAIPAIDTRGRAGTPCGDTADCRDDLCCGNQGVCRAPHGGGVCGAAAGEVCGLSADCDVGLVCDGTGTCADPGGAKGQAGQGEPCEEITDCLRPLICSATNTCETPPFFTGVSCVRSEEDLAAFRGYFEVPRGEPLDEFFRQPFPSDVRLVDGKPDLTGHPSPGDVSGIDFDEVYLRALEEDMDGFGLTQPVFLRFSDPLDPATVTATAAVPGVALVDLEDGAEIPIQTKYVSKKQQFICHSSLAVAPIDGFVLRPNHTYAVIVRSTIRNIRGEAPRHDADFAAMLADATPEDPHVATAHAAYAPLRAYVAGGGMNADEIAIAAVYTTGDPGRIGPRVFEAVRAAPEPIVAGSVVCDMGVMSPCQGPPPRGCRPADPTFTEIHATVTNPRLQQGTRPYAVPAQGGAIALDPMGRIMPNGSEAICIGITVPSGPMPPAGWPVVVYGHGTGGDFTSGLVELAGDFAAAGIAMITFDGSQHGPRQEIDPPVDPGRMFFNASNPRAARDNVLQGAADVHNLVRLARTLDLASLGIGGVAGTFNPDRVMYYGHSQGTVVGAPFIAIEPDLKAAVFTGAGAEIGLTLVNKRKPNDVAALTRSIFGDQSISRLHPMIAVMTWFFGPTDATTYAVGIKDRPPMMRGPVDFLHVYGVEDGFTPEVTQAALIRAGRYPIVGTALVEIEGVPTVPTAPIGALMYEPSRTDGVLDYDGHFVGTRNPEARAAVLRFLTSVAMGMPGRIER